MKSPWSKAPTSVRSCGRTEKYSKEVGGLTNRLVKRASMSLQTVHYAACITPALLPRMLLCSPKAIPPPITPLTFCPASQKLKRTKGFNKTESFPLITSQPGPVSMSHPRQSFSDSPPQMWVQLSGSRELQLCRQAALQAAAHTLEPAA